MNPEELLRLLQEIRDPEYRRGFVEGHAKDTIAFQIRQLRKSKGWEQRDLARELGNEKLQPMISRYENPDYGRYSISTLLELAAVFDVGLVVRFAPFSEMVEWDVTANEETLCPSPYAHDAELGELEKIAKQGERSVVNLLPSHAIGQKHPYKSAIMREADPSEPHHSGRFPATSVHTTLHPEYHPTFGSAAALGGGR